MKARIMIVDDAAFMRAILKDILIHLDYEIVAEGSNGQEAVNMYKRTKPDLVTMDITMPEMNGIEALYSVKIDMNDHHFGYFQSGGRFFICLKSYMPSITSPTNR